MADKNAAQQFTPVRGTDENSASTDIESRWEELRSKIRKEWPALSKADLALIDGDSRKLVALVQQKTGAEVSVIEAKIDEIAAASEGLLNRLARTVQSAASQASHAVADPVMQAYHSVEGQVAATPVRSCGVAFGTGLIIGVLTASLLKDAWMPKRQSVFDLW